MQIKCIKIFIFFLFGLMLLPADNDNIKHFGGARDLLSITFNGSIYYFILVSNIEIINESTILLLIMQSNKLDEEKNVFV